MSKGITIADLETARDWHQDSVLLSPWELWEALADTPYPYPLTDLCKRHGWSRPSDATLDFIDACGERLQRRMESHIRGLNT